MTERESGEERWSLYIVSKECGIFFCIENGETKKNKIKNTHTVIHNKLRKKFLFYNIVKIGLMTLNKEKRRARIMVFCEQL